MNNRNTKPPPLKGQELMNKLLVPPDLRPAVAQFLQESGLALQLVDAEPYDLQVLLSSDPPEPSDTQILRAGGSITCATAWKLGQQHNLDLLKLGALFDLLEIRVCDCCLGCFK